MLEKLWRLAKEEGGKVFFVDKETEEVYCLLTLEKYEQLKNGKVQEKNVPEMEARSGYADLSEEELLDKMQSEIAAWRNHQPEKSEMEMAGKSLNLEMRPEEKAPEAVYKKVQTKALEDEEHFFLEMS